MAKYNVGNKLQGMTEEELIEYALIISKESF